MSHHDSTVNGFVIAERMARRLAVARRIIVVTNSRRVPEDYFQRIVPDDGDVFVVFNRHRFTIDKRHAARTIWVHRFDEAAGEYFGETARCEAATAACHRLRVTANIPPLAEVSEDVSYLSYRASLPGLRDYPVGRRLLIPQRGVRRIVSPSTGFAVFALLDELRRRLHPFQVQAVGVGREYDGWPGHAWDFERDRLRRCAVEFRTPDGLPDRWLRMIDRLPFEVVRPFSRLASALRGRHRRAA